MCCGRNARWVLSCSSPGCCHFSDWRMHSATEPTAAASSPAVSRLRVRLERWNRKLHYYAGLFLLFFLWLFAVTGLVLNHPTWSFAESWTKRKETNSERTITALGPELRGDLTQARAIMQQLGIEGEIGRASCRERV